MITNGPARVDANTVRELVAHPGAATIIDVRSPAEFETVRIRGSVNVPLDVLADHADALAARLDGKVVLVCQSGVRAEQARQHLAGFGVEGVHVLDGGIASCATTGGDADASIVRGRVRWSLDRQVRLVAGTLVLTGLVAGLRAPRARLLSGLIGAGLTLSALTNTCAMGRILSTLPYNRGPRGRTPAEVLARIPAAPGRS